MKESAVQSKILRELKKNSYVVKVQSASKAGVPDILACYPTIITPDMVGKSIGLFIGIEVKTPDTKNNVSELQKINLEAINNASGLSAVIWSLEGLQKFLEDNVNETL
ncbi:MAG TPA: hypothetical protein PKI46_03005 [Bacteroidales bacterium]|nr:hypothetical protein [Bacteroidales bacterium]